MSDEPAPNHSPPRYQILEEIARGGMGVVYRVNDLDLDRVLAMKRLTPTKKDISADAQSDIYARFLEEVQVTAQLDHPAIVPVHDLGFDDDGAPFYTMRYVKGRHLGEIIKQARNQQEGWKLTRLIDVFIRVCQALAYAHAKGVIHRDLKPRNIMVGDLGEVYVMDWGLARMLNREDLRDIRLHTEDGGESETIIGIREGMDDASIDAPLKTIDGAIIGTPAYMSPEQANGLIAEVDHLSDVYSLGAILYQILSGRAPYMSRGRRTTPMLVLSELGQGPPESVTSVDASAPTELVAICEKAMSRRREDRYQSSIAFADDLQAYLDNRVVSAYESGPIAEAKKWARRNRLWRWVAPSLGAITIITMFAFALSRRSEKRAIESMGQAIKSESDAIVARSQAEDLVKFTLIKIYNKLESTGDLSVLEQVLTQIEGYLQTLPMESLNMPQALFLQSLTTHRMALIERARGQTIESLASMQKAVAFRERFAQASTSPDRVSYLASIYDSLGVMLLESNQLDEAEATFRKALPIYDLLLTEHPNDSNLINNLANYRNNSGRLAEEQKDYEAASNSYSEAIILREKILAKHPDRSLVRFGKAAAMAHLGRCQTKMGLIDVARRTHQAAAQEMRGLLETDATEVLHLTGMALVMRPFAELDLLTGKFETARAHCLEGIDYANKALATDPSNVRHLIRLAALQRLSAEASIHLKLEPADQVASILATLEANFTEHPKNTTLTEELLEMNLTAARLHAGRSPAAALTLLTKAITISEQQLEAVGNDLASATYRWRLYTAACSKLAGRLCQQIDDRSEAKRHFEVAEAGYASLEDRLSVTECIELAELRLWSTGPSLSIHTQLTNLNDQLVKRQTLLWEMTDQ